LAGIDDKTPDPPGGKIVRDAAGVATGILIDSAMDLVESKIPAPTDEVIRRRILAASSEALRHGLTTVHEMGINPDVIRVYRGLADEGRLPLRVYAFLSGDLETARALPNRIAEVDREGTSMFI